MKNTLPYLWLVLLAAVAMPLRGDRHQAKDGHQQNDPVRAIAKYLVFSTSSQDDLKHVYAGFLRSVRAEEYDPAFPYSNDLKIITQTRQGSGSSNIFVVRGDDIVQAINSTRWVIEAGQSVDVLPPPPFGHRKTGENLWLVVYLGRGYSTPPKWDFKSASVRQQTIEFRYGESETAIISLDGIPYWYWLPLPPLKAGVYELRLFDADKGRPKLARWITIPEA